MKVIVSMTHLPKLPLFCPCTLHCAHDQLFKKPRKMVGSRAGAVVRFQPPPRHTQHADFPHCGCWDLAHQACRLPVQANRCCLQIPMKKSIKNSMWSLIEFEKSTERKASSADSEVLMQLKIHNTVIELVQGDRLRYRNHTGPI